MGNADHGSLHKGHRTRVRERFFSEGFDCFNDHMVLEMLLFYCVPRKDTNELAHKLLTHFGTFHKVLEADTDELRCLGLSENGAGLLRYIYDLLSAVYHSSGQSKRVTLTADMIDSFLLDRYVEKDSDETCILLLDPKCSKLYCERFKQGTISDTTDAEKIVRLALMYNAAGAVIAKSRNGSSLVPDTNDIEAAKMLGTSLGKAGLCLIDYIIFSETECFSMGRSEYRGLFI